ncbi:MAG TPA: aminoacyl-tRNA hydrolase [Actinomycetota bacterium]|jgi:PTH1 family peptidyl-tRNA hydrolase
MAESWLVAGLGNPGERYAETRHNAGAMVIQTLCERFGTRPRKVRFVPVAAADTTYQGTPLSLVLAAAYMNESGPPLASFARKRDIPVERVVIVHDDIDLAFGALRIKRGGGTAGHHGLDSIVQAFRSPDFYRVRLGVGRPPGRQDTVKFVLQPFAKREQADAEVLVQDAADATLSLVADGLERTQDRFNRSGPPA